MAGDEKPAHHSSRFHHGFYEVFLPVTDVDRAAAWYVEKLGFTLGWRDKASALLLYDNAGVRSMLGLYHVDVVDRRHHVSFRIAEQDVDRMLAYLLEHKIQPVHPARAHMDGPVHEPIVHGWMPAASLYFEDPDDHLLEFIADLAETPRPDIQYCPLSKWRAMRDEPTS
jgi:catechol 2,3-dioxygenase-like lactoylglutathione lyase family enzyme